MDNEFTNVEEKKTRDNDKGDFRRRDKQTMAQTVHKQKLNARLEEEKASSKVNMQGPQQTKKRAEWHKKTQRAQMAGNTQGGYGSYQRRGLREASYEIKPEWPTVFEFPKQRHDKLLDLKPADLGVIIEAGQIHQFDMQWTRARV